eukprot:1154149-Ditylum_brightwellii.AAC.1
MERGCSSSSSDNTYTNNKYNDDDNKFWDDGISSNNSESRRNNFGGNGLRDAAGTASESEKGSEIRGDGETHNGGGAGVESVSKYKPGEYVAGPNTNEEEAAMDNLAEQADGRLGCSDTQPVSCTTREFNMVGLRETADCSTNSVKDKLANKNSDESIGDR